MRPKSRATNLILTCALGFVVFQENIAAQDFWQRMNGPYGGTIRSLAVSESGFLFAGTDRGLYRSTNGGAGWQQVADIPLDVAVSAILFHPSGAILAGTMYEGIWRSADHGETWKNVGLTGIDVRAIVCDSLGQIYAGTYNNGIYFSTDQGVNWASFALSRESVFALFFTSSGVLLAGVTDGVFRSDDNGQNWVFVEIKDTNVHSFVENSFGYIFAATSDKGIFRSVDGGESWKQIDNGLTARFVLPIARYLQDEIFVGTDDGVFRSVDYGETWVQGGLKGRYVLSFAIDSVGNIFAGTLSQGLFRSSDNGASWVETNMGIMNTRIFCLTATPNGELLAGTRSGAIYRSKDNGQAWSKVYEAEYDVYPSHLISSPQGQALAVVGRRLLRSGDGGRTWEQFFHPLHEEPVATLKYTRLDEIYLGGSRGKLYRSQDGGQLWTLLFAGDDYQQSIEDIDVNAKGDIFFATRGAGLYRSSDSGKSWQRLDTPFSDRQLFGLIIDQLGQIYVGTNSGGVFISVDNGSSWIEGGLKYVTGEKLVLDAYGNIFAATLHGAFESKNNSMTWTEIHSGMGELSILDFTVAPTGYLFAGTDGNGIFRSLHVTGTKPESFSFLQNYPNPFNATTTIEFQLARRSLVRLAIYNLSGQKIATLVDQGLSPGIYPIRWDAKRFASGIYLCRIRTEQVSETIKLLLVK